MSIVCIEFDVKKENNRLVKAGFAAIVCQNIENQYAFVKKLVMEKQSIF